MSNPIINLLVIMLHGSALTCKRGGAAKNADETSPSIDQYRR